MPIHIANKRLTIGVGVAVVVALMLWVLGPVLVPFAVAGVLAYALHPAVLRLVRQQQAWQQLQLLALGWRRVQRQSTGRRQR